MIHTHACTHGRRVEESRRKSSCTKQIISASDMFDTSNALPKRVIRNNDLYSYGLFDCLPACMCDHNMFTWMMPKCNKSICEYLRCWCWCSNLQIIREKKQAKEMRRNFNGSVISNIINAHAPAFRQADRHKVWKRGKPKHTYSYMLCKIWTELR